MANLLTALEDILGSTNLPISSLRPSEWYESKMVMPSGSARPGPFSFDHTPYLREIVNCGGRDHPAREISFMKGAQLGGTAAVINAIIGYTISQNPGNSMLLTGHTELSEAAFLKVDTMIDNCGLRPMIKPNILRAKNSRTADTGSLKEFPGGSLVGGSVTNHNLLRQYDIMLMIVDDFDASKMSSKEAGSTRELVQQRTNAFAHKKKIFYVSSPQLKGMSNIDSVFVKGDQRYYKVPCPKCHKYIFLKWEIKVTDRDPAGIIWELDSHGNLDTKSVGYICQECAGFFNDSHKFQMNIDGFWEPTAIPVEENHFSYQLPSLYSPSFMDGWAVIVQKYLNANPKNAAPIESKVQTFFNLQLGEPYEKIGKGNDASGLLKNIRPYAVGIIPDIIARERDGNGSIVIVTCAVDLNGKIEDARADYEVVAWSETGASYSITHGSIGTFVYKEGEDKGDRPKLTYEHKKPNSLWPELEKVLGTVYKTQSGKQMKIVLTGVDCGHFTTLAYAFIDKTNHNVIGVKGDKENQYRKFGIDVPIFRHAKERTRLFLLDVNHIKDTVSNMMDLKWSPVDGEVQPVDYMNYPQPLGNKYMHDTYFKHYEAEERIEDKKEGEGVASRWMKKKGGPQNHFWDVRIYNYALREIYADMTLRMNKPPMKGNWHDFVAYAKLYKKI